MFQIAGFVSFCHLNSNAIRNTRYDIRKNVLNFELWFFAFLPVRCLTASVLAQAGTQTGSFKFLVIMV
jgi:hypothetical protein